MHTRHVRKAQATSLAMSIPVEAVVAERRRFLHILLGASLAAASLAIAGCAATSPRETPPTYRRGAGNRGGDAAGSHRG